MKKFFFLSAAGLLAACTPDSASRAPVASTPPTVATTAQSPGAAAPSAVPAHYAAFVGRWTGFWDGAASTILIVENVSPQGALTGTYQFMSGAPGPIRSQVSGNAFQFGSAVRFTFTLMPDGRMRGERVAPGQTNTVMLTRS